MATQKIKSPSTLRELEFLTYGQTETETDLILIAGVGSCSVEEWGICSGQWYEFYTKLHTRIRVLAFEHGVFLDEAFSWQLLLDKGGELLSELFELYASDDSPRPMVFMCYSLGGIILKQAICIANMQHHKYASLLNCISGIVFIGAPHSLASSDALGERALLLIDCFPSEQYHNKQFKARLKEESSKLTNIASRFQDVSLQVDILSVYESEKTKVAKNHIFSKPRKVIIIDKEISSTHAPLEQCVALPISHGLLYKLTQEDGRPNQQVQTWLGSVIESSVNNIQERMRSYHIRHTPSLTSSSFSSFAAKEVLSKDLGTEVTGQGSSDGQYGSSTFDAEMIPILDGFSPPRKKAKLPCFMVDTFVKNREFFGRQDIIELLDSTLLPPRDLLVSSEPNTMKCVSLCGMAGLGKTEIAIEYAFSRKDRFDAIFWVSADNLEKLGSDFSRIATVLDLEDPNEPHNQVVNRELAKGWLSHPLKFLDQNHDSVGQAEASWLIIFDNADDPDILTDYIPIFDSGSLLITSRNPLSKTNSSPTTLGIDLIPFKEEEAALFLQQLTHKTNEGDIAKQVANKLGGLPLAISQMAGVIRRQYLSFPEFLERYEDEEEKEGLLNLELQPHRVTARGTIASIWAIEQLSRPARSFLEVLSIFDPDCIQEDVLINRLEVIDTLSEYPKKKAAYYAARMELLQTSLIKRNEERKEFWMHRVLQDAVRAKMEAQHLFRVFSAATNLISAAWPPASLEKRHNTDRWKACQDLYPHVISLRNIYIKYFTRKDYSLNAELAALFSEAGWWQHERGNASASKSLLQHAEVICHKLPLDGRIGDILCDIHYGLGAVANESNDAESCLRHNKELLAKRMDAAKEAGLVDIRLAIAHNQIGTGWMMAKEYQKASEAFKNAIEVYQSLPDFSKGMLSVPLANLGLAYWLQGDLDKASITLERGLRDREELLGVMDKESFRTGRFLHALGNIRADQGQMEESEIYHQKALAQYQSTIGNSHHRTADVCHRVAQHCIRHGDFDTARILIDQALKVWGTERSLYTPEIARTSFLKAKLLYRIGDEEEASILVRQAVALRNKIAPIPTKDYKMLTEESFDELVTFWSR
ncbi:MAG: hypothetical protein M1834_003265 [Cirrosporium novae-zelandiae]|nr:MAG: hypothetical protein M1834_003265 [Cirrosporium novae-zelandiae]